MVGGVSSPVSAFKAVGGVPIFMASGQGSKIRDVDGNRYIDYVCSWGPMIPGHSHPAVVKATFAAVERGTSFGAPTVSELKLAEKVCSLVPSIEKVRFVNSGTEATMSALRLARAYTRGQAAEVRRLLPRARRRLPDACGVGACDAGRPELRGRAGIHRRGRRDGPLQRRPGA